MEYWGSAFLVRKRDTCSVHFGIERNKLPPIRTYFETKERKSFYRQPGITGQGRLSLIIPTMRPDLRITKKITQTNRFVDRVNPEGTMGCREFAFGVKGMQAAACWKALEKRRMPLVSRECSVLLFPDLFLVVTQLRPQQAHCPCCLFGASLCSQSAGEGFRRISRADRPVIP
jgi:hypothetical protein